MLKRFSLLSLVLILALAAWYFINKENSVISSQDFVIDNISNIDKIIFEKDNQSLKLEQVNKEWLVNDTFQLNVATLKRFLKVFSNLNLIAPISSNARDTVISYLHTSSTKISVFANNNLRKEYLLGDLNNSGSGNVVLLNDEKLAVVNSMILVQDLNDIVSVNSLFWRNRMIFNKRTDQISRIIHANIKDTLKSYTISVENKNLRLYDFANHQIKIFNETAVERYISYFQNIGFEKIENSLIYEQKDSIIKFNKLHRIVLIDKSEISYELDLYLKPAKISVNGMSKEFDLNRIYGKMNNEENMLIFEYYIIDPILKDIDYFIEN